MTRVYRTALKRRETKEQKCCQNVAKHCPYISPQSKLKLDENRDTMF